MPTKVSRPRHDNHVRQLAERVVSRMQRQGLALLCQHRWFGVAWCLSDGTKVDAEVGKVVAQDRRIAGVGDSLFPGAALSQTYRHTGQV